jgi:hypothetical protein
MKNRIGVKMLSVFLILIITPFLLKATQIRTPFSSSYNPEAQYEMPKVTVLGGFYISSLKYINIGFDLKVAYQPAHFIAIGAGTAVNAMIYTIETTSDEHAVDLSSFPSYFFGELFFRNSPKYNDGFYVYGKKGRNFFIKSDDHIPTKGFKGQFNEMGIGYIFNKKEFRKNIRFEIGRHQLTYSGLAYNTYNSEINYNLKYSSYLVRMVVGF